MFIIFDDDRPSDSPFVERVYGCHSESAGTFLSVASSHWDLVFTRLAGRTTVTLKGPETTVRPVHCPADGEWLGIRFKAGTFMPQVSVASLLDGRDVTLHSSTRWFHFHGADWEYPDLDNVETFVARLARAGIIARDTAVAAALQGDTTALSARSAQRHFLHATGMTHGALRQIERARYATNLLRRGVSIADTVHEAGYFDQSHLTRSLRRLIGLTPAQIALGQQQLSFLYKTPPPT
ncbi:MAG TPA: helix-turn-helix domain-containing protein [Povalibacter sp.]|nr:helix-turn-helix domain-containing protein [Povalibacter sp.]